MYSVLCCCLISVRHVSKAVTAAQVRFYYTRSQYLARNGTYIPGIDSAIMLSTNSSGIKTKQKTDQETASQQQASTPGVVHMANHTVFTGKSLKFRERDIVHTSNAPPRGGQQRIAPAKTDTKPKYSWLCLETLTFLERLRGTPWSCQSYLPP